MTDPADVQPPGISEEDVEVVDGVPVPEPETLRQAPLTVAEAPRTALGLSLPVARQAAVVAVTGFAAGAATVAVVRSRRGRKALGRGRKAATKELGEGRLTRSFLVDVHVLDRG